MAIINSNVATTATSVYTSTGSSAVVTIHLCNFTNASQTVNVYAVSSGNVASNYNIIYSNYNITAYNTLIINTEKFILSDQDSIRVNCSNVSAVTATVSYIGI